MNFRSLLKHSLVLLTLSLTSLTALAHDKSHDTKDKVSYKNPSHLTEQFLTGGQPSIDDLKILKAKGVKKVINLRATGEFDGFNEKEVVESLGMEYVHIPVKGASGVNKANLKAFTAAISADKNKTFVHCASSNRVGAFFALDAYINDKKDIESAVALGKKTGLSSLEPKVRSFAE